MIKSNVVIRRQQFMLEIWKKKKGDVLDHLKKHICPKKTSQDALCWKDIHAKSLLSLYFYDMRWLDLMNQHEGVCVCRAL